MFRLSRHSTRSTGVEDAQSRKSANIENARSKGSAKIAIASLGKTLESPVDPRFGRCPYFLIIESETSDFEAIENAAGQTFRGAGISAAQMIANKNVQAVIAGNFGPNAFNVLSSSGIKIYSGVFGITAKKALEEYHAGKLKETTASTSAPFGRGFGRCRGEGGERRW